MALVILATREGAMLEEKSHVSISRRPGAVDKTYLMFIDMKNISLFLKHPDRSKNTRVKSMIKVAVITSQLLDILLVLIVDPFRGFMIRITVYIEMANSYVRMQAHVEK